MEISEVKIPIDKNITLRGDLSIPVDSSSFVIFSHGSGSSRFSPRNQHVAKILNSKKIATLLTDLLTEEEDREYANRFDIDLITQRLIAVTTHMQQIPGLQYLKTGYFGASTGAASALKAAAELGDSIHAIVSRGGRPDLAYEALQNVKAPTLLIVGGLDHIVIGLNQKAFNTLNCEKSLEIIEGATHLFEEPGKLDAVATLACEWFTQHLHPDAILTTNHIKDDKIP